MSSRRPKGGRISVTHHMNATEILRRYAPLNDNFCFLFLKTISSIHVDKQSTHPPSFPAAIC